MILRDLFTEPIAAQTGARRLRHLSSRAAATVVGAAPRTAHAPWNGFGMRVWELVSGAAQLYARVLSSRWLPRDGTLASEITAR
jgi:hypothetical protein